MGETARRKSPISIDSVECGNGRKKVVVREREYDAVSWQGLKTFGALISATIAVILTVLTAYYTAEASQNIQITAHGNRLDEHDRRLSSALDKLGDMLKEQKTVLDRQREAFEAQTKVFVKLSTRQDDLILPAINKLDSKLDRLDEKVDRFHRP